MRAVLDVNVVVAGVLSASGSPARILRAWREGDFEFVASPNLLDELERTMAYPKIRSRVTTADSEALLQRVRAEAVMLEDPAEVHSLRSVDPGDDYLIALAAAAGAVLVSGDRHLLDLAGAMPVLTPAEFLELFG